MQDDNLLLTLTSGAKSYQITPTVSKGKKTDKFHSFLILSIIFLVCEYSILCSTRVPETTWRKIIKKKKFTCQLKIL